MRGDFLEVTYGYCRCGCGEKTNIAKQTRTSLGYRKGDRANYLPGHALKGVVRDRHPLWRGGKKNNNGHIIVSVIEDKQTIQMAKHRFIAIDLLKKPLPAKAQIHHINHNPSDNRNENLIICEDDAYHKLLHRREIALKECGHANWRRCNYCHKLDDVTNLQISPNKRRICHPVCGKKYNTEYNRRIKK